jgi:hypothetical protein
MFVKYGDGAIVKVLEEEDLTEEQKKSAQILSSQEVKQVKDPKPPTSESN